MYETRHLNEVLATLNDRNSPDFFIVMNGIIHWHHHVHELEHDLYVEDTTRPLPANMKLLLLDSLVEMVRRVQVLPESFRRAEQLRFQQDCKQEESKHQALLASLQARQALRLLPSETPTDAVFLNMCEDTCQDILWGNMPDHSEDEGHDFVPDTTEMDRAIVEAILRDIEEGK